ncbi:MAG: lipopolysaccharide biosynthesis protein [Patescibacteria group bacterium]
MGYFKEALVGISWMGLLRGSTRGLALLKMVVLARFLTPAQFGIFGIALLVLAFLEIITETGINVVLIQEEDEIDSYISTAWLVSIARGVLISLTIFLLAPLIAGFFKSSESSAILRLTSLIPLTRGFINPAIVKFQKELKFNKEFWFRTFLYLVDTTCAILLGIMTRSELAFIWGMFLSAFAEVIISFSVVSPRPFFSFDSEKVKKVIARGRWITLAGTFEYLFQHLDDIIVGKLLGTAPLGLYQQAYRVSTLPISEVGEVFNKVTFPTYAKIAADRQRLKKAFLKITGVIGLLVIPFGFLLFSFSREVIVLLFGEAWLGAVGALKVLAIFGILKALSDSAYSLFLSVKKQEIVTMVTLFGILGLSLPLIPLVNKFGIVGAAYATIVGTLTASPVILYHLKKVLGAGQT